MANKVEIQIAVTDNGSPQVIGQSEKALDQLGAAGARASKQVGDAMQKVGGHTTTALDGVRLLSQEFGLRLPRALEAMLSRMPAVTSAISSMVGALAGVAIAEVFIRGAEAIYDAEQKYISINSAAEKYYETLKKTAELDFTNTRDLETTQRRMAESTQSMIAGQKAAPALQRAGLLSMLQAGGPGGMAAGIGEIFGAKSVGDSAATGMAQTVELTRKQIDQTHEQALASIELAHALDGEHSKRQQIADDLAKQQSIAAENRKYGRQVQGFYGNPTPGSAGQSEQDIKDAQAADAARIRSTDLANQETTEIMKSRAAAVESGLEGEALYAQKQKDSIAQVTQALITQHEAYLIPQRVKDLNEQYENETAARIQKQIADAQKMLNDAQSSGLTGAARIAAEHSSKIDDINTNRTLDPQAAATQRQAAAVRASNDLLALQQQFTDRAKELTTERTEDELGAYGKIDAAAQRQVAEIEKSYTSATNSAETSTAQQIALAQQKANAIAAIEANAASQRAELDARNRAEDEQYDREASQAEARVRADGIAGWVASYKDGIAAIEAQEQQRLAKLQQDIQREGLTWQEAAQRREDIERQASAEIAEQNQQLQHTIAGQLQSAFTDPVKYIKQKMEEMFFEIVAGWLMRLNVFKALFGSTMGGLQPGGGAGGGGGLLGALTGGQRAVTGTGGVISSGTYLPGGTSGGFSGTSANPGAVFGGTTSTTSAGPSYGRDISSSISDAGSLYRAFGLTGTQGSVVNGGDANTNVLDGSGSDSSAYGGLDSGSASSATGALGAGLGIATAGLGAYQGAQGVLSSFTKGGLTGVLDGTMSGLAAGAAIGSLAGPLGTVVGGAIGAGVGLVTNLVGQIMGEPGRVAARDYYKKTVEPELQGIEKQWDAGNGNGDYLSAISEANKDAGDAMNYMRSKFGGGAADWVNANYMAKQLNIVTSHIEQMAGSGSEYSGRTAAEFHSGGIIGGFGDLSTTSTEGYIHAMRGEGIVNLPATRVHGAAIGMMNAGASAADMATHYLSQSGGGMRGGGGGTTTHHHWNVKAIDAQSFGKFLDKGGGVEQIQRSTNKYASRYAGDGIG